MAGKTEFKLGLRLTLGAIWLAEKLAMNQSDRLFEELNNLNYTTYSDCGPGLML
jgi:hypothetical protein